MSNINYKLNKFINNLGHFRGVNITIDINTPKMLYRLQNITNKLNDDYVNFLKDNNLIITNLIIVEEGEDGEDIKGCLKLRVWDNPKHKDCVEYEEKVEKDLKILLDYIKNKV